MKRVYKGSGPTDAYLVQHWLKRNDVVAVLRSDLVGLAGEIPMGDAWPTVWVQNEDEVRAKALIDAFHGPRLVHPQWKCTQCGELSPPNFGSCWNCDADQPVTD